MVNKKIKYIDISPEISENIAVFPGDTKFSRKINLDFKKGDNLLLSEINSTVHLGAHVDAPNHYSSSSIGISDRKLDYYLGECQVISVNLPLGKRIYPKDIIGIEILAKRILFKTSSFNDPNTWHNDFNSLSPELIEYLVKQKVILVGIDTPSVDPADSKDLETHNCIHKNNLAILEGIILIDVDDGLYTLIALPLKIKDADASPVRAILIKP